MGNIPVTGFQGQALSLGCKSTAKTLCETAFWCCQPLPPRATCCHLLKKLCRLQEFDVSLQRDSRNERFGNMKKETFKYLANRLRGDMPNRIFASSDTRFYNNAVIQVFNDFMTQCRQSPVIRIRASPLKRIRDEPVKHRCENTRIQTGNSV